MSTFTESQGLCTVCGRDKGTSLFPRSSIGKLYHQDACYGCYIWYAKTSSLITKQRFPKGTGEYKACYKPQCQKLKGQSKPFRCLLPEGHTGAHIAFSVHGEIYDAWNSERGWFGLPVPELDKGGYWRKSIVG